MPSKTRDEDLELAASRMPKELREQARAKAKGPDMTISQLMHRALRRKISGRLPEAAQ